jgi:phosphatidylglycerophosphatase C
MTTSTPTVAAFDLDGTLTEGGSVFHWLAMIGGSARLYLAAARLIIPLTIGSIRSSHHADNAKERLFHAILAGRSEEQIRERSREFGLQHLQRDARAHVIDRLLWHLARGDDVVIVSASPQYYVTDIAEKLGAHGALGTRLGVDARGKLTGSYLGKNCRGTEKMRRLEEWIAQRKYPTRPVIYAYGNSRGDKRLLTMADYPFNVGKMGRWGRLRRYPRLPKN